jgi:glycosyltransferase involved in cell wall biosynthesis
VIGISLLTLAPGRMGGSETYARALTDALGRVGTLEYLVAAPPDAVDAAGGLPVVAAGAPGSSSRVRAFASAGRARQALQRAAAVHFPLTVPLARSRAPSVITLHDVLHHDHRRLVSRGQRVFRAFAYDRAARAADLVIVPSRFVQERAQALIRLDAASVRVVAHGVDHSVFRPGDEPRRPFLLYPARAWPHKNHARLLDAFAQVRRERPELELVLTGGGHEGRAVPPGVRIAGVVPVEELARLYRTAEAMVFPSLYEGFGAPILEAMASGCAVAASNAGALPEVAGQAAVLFDPTSVKAIAQGVLQAIGERSALAERGLIHARRFTWEATARAHEDVYSELLD